MSSSLLFIYNPRSGTQTIAKRLSDIVSIWTAAGFDVTVHPTQAQSDCRDTLVRIGKNFDRIVVAGGDGTHNEAVNGLLDAGIQKPYGYIPCGSTNDFSHSIGIPVRPLQAAKNCLYGTPFPYDIGKMNGRAFTYVAGFGAFTEVTYSTPQEQKNTLGYAAYIIAALGSIQNIVPWRLNFTSEERSGSGEYVLGLVTNTLQVGGMKNLLPHDIALDDGLFEVLLVKNPRNPIELNKILMSAMKRDFGADCFEYFRTKKIVFEAEKPLKWTLDGENGGEHYKTEITCLPRALSVLTSR